MGEHLDPSGIRPNEDDGVDVLCRASRFMRSRARMLTRELAGPRPADWSRQERREQDSERDGHEYTYTRYRATTQVHRATVTNG